MNFLDTFEMMDFGVVEIASVMQVRRHCIKCLSTILFNLVFSSFYLFYII